MATIGPFINSCKKRAVFTALLALIAAAPAWADVDITVALVRYNNDVIISSDGMDFGDCPSTYSTLLVNEGARHIIDPNVFLGSGIDSELDGQPTIWADGDDVNGIPDEDGVYFPSVLFTDCTRDVNVVASCEGILDAWFDFNADGDWADPCEQIFASEPLYAGSNILTFSIPFNAAVGDTYARFRFSTVGGLEPNGPAPNGEIEDYLVSILPDCEQWLRDCWWGRRDWEGGEYEDWIQFNKPACWCEDRQCQGDADGVLEGDPKGGYFYVGAGDLGLLLAAWKVLEPADPPTPSGPGILSVPNGICADFDHLLEGDPKGGYFRVGAGDLGILLASWKILEPADPPTPSGPGIWPVCWCGSYPP